MKRWETCLSVLCLAALASAIAVSTAHAAPATCSILAGKTYHCTQKTDLSSSVIEDDWAFSSNEDGKLSLHTLTQGDFRCTCQAKGNYKKPKFDTSLGFVCGGTVPGSVGDAISGKVTGNAKTLTGQLLDVNAAGTDAAGIFTCTPTDPIGYTLVQSYTSHCVPYNYLNLFTSVPATTYYEAYQYCAQQCASNASCVQMWVSYTPGTPRTGPFWCLTGGGGDTISSDNQWNAGEIQCNYPPIGANGDWYSRLP